MPWGPVIYDPRSGEILSAYTLLWPSVLDFFSAYYFVNPGAKWVNKPVE